MQHTAIGGILPREEIKYREIEGGAVITDKTPSGNTPLAPRDVVGILYSPGQKEKKKDTDWCLRNRGIHAKREDFCRLPLTSELFDLRF